MTRAPTSDQGAKLPRAAFLLLRLGFLGFWSVTYAYCLFAYIPFTFTQVIQAGLLPWLAWFARNHVALYWVTSAGALATLWPDRRAAHVKRLVMSYAAATLAAGVALTIHPVLSSLENDTTSFVWANVALVPIVALAAIDHAAARGVVRWTSTSTREDTSVFAAGAATFAIAFVVYSATFHARAAAGLGLAAREEAVGLLWSLLLHACFAGMAFILWSLVRALGAWLRGSSAATEYALVVGLAIALVAWLARDVVLAAIALRGPVASGAAIAWACAHVAALSGVAVRDAAAAQSPADSGLRVLLSPLSLPRAPLAARVAWLVAIAALTVPLQIAASRMDWNGLVQRLCAASSWVMLFAAALAVLRPAAGGARALRLMAAATAGIVLYGGWRWLGHPAETASVRSKLAAAEPSFGLLHAVTGDGKRASMSELFDFVQRNTNLPPTCRVEPRDVQFAADLGSAPGPRPDIFVIVVDSLRRDYVAPFNPAVTFTPSIEKFARASDVFTNAFTRYGATGLSEPSIWVGGMMPHKQYISPFSPMNALEKLLVAEKYARMISMDSILVQLLERGSSLAPLDEHTATGDYDLCATLDELRGRIDARTPGGAPIFAYTQPQNIHVSRVTREGASVPPGVAFPGFYAPYAYRLRRIDACFGKFIEYLDARGLYDESIIVLTADHGDLLGEEGRWGHAYMLSPEIVRIPLVIHRPKRLGALPVDARAIAFSTDITPSLYRLLGYTPEVLGGGFGQSLYGPRAVERSWHMLVSSYGPVYGVLEDDGRHLYVADAVAYTDTYFDVTSSSNAPRDPVSEETRRRNVERIVAGVRELHEAFRVPESAGAAITERLP